MSVKRLPRRSLLFVSPVLAGCSVLPSPKAAQIYRISPPIRDPRRPAIPNTELIIDLPTTSQSLDTDRIALTLGRTRFDYYADSVWTDRVPMLLQTLMVESFEADGRLSNVGRNIYGLARGYLLETEIRQFEAEYPDPAAGPPEVAVVLELHLSTGPEHRAIGNRLISARVHASRNDISAIVIAFDAATADVLAQTVAWTFRAISPVRARAGR